MKIINKKIVARVVFVAILLLAAVLRIPYLSLRPVHGDEANQAVKAGHLYDTGQYTYDPHEHHGPTLYFLTLPFLYLSGVSSFEESTIVSYRAVVVFFSLVFLILFWFLKDALSIPAVLCVALFAAVSHVMVFYSRYYVQEMLLLCFTQGALVSAWRYIKGPSWFWALCFGLSGGLMHATKETVVLIALSACLGAAMVGGFAWFREGRQLFDGVIYRTFSHALLAASVAVFVSVIFYSSFFTHMRGPLDSLLAYAQYLGRAGGVGSSGIHDKPWYYYLHLLLYTYRQVGPRWTEAPVLIAFVIGILAIVWGSLKTRSAEGDLAARLFQLFIVSYAVVTLIVYSLIPYKTPWNLLVFYHGVLLTAGLGASWLFTYFRNYFLKGVVVLLFIVSLMIMGRQAYYGNYVYYADIRNPYVYAHPSKAMERMVNRIHEIAESSGRGVQLHVNIIRLDGDYWPLPWYLRGYKRVGWWHKIPANADADIVIASPDLSEDLQHVLKQTYLVEFHALRPGVLLHAYIREDLWNQFIKMREAI